MRESGSTILIKEKADIGIHLAPSIPETGRKIRAWVWTRKWSNGISYTGHYSLGAKKGFETIYLNGNSFYKGEFKDDQFHRRGIHVFPGGRQ